MKKSVFAVCLIVLIEQGYSLNGQTIKTNFRDAKWGISQKAVINLEGKEPLSKDKDNQGLEYIAFQGMAGNLDCSFVYYFAEDKLVQGRYVFSEKHTNKNSYIDDYKTVKDSLSEKYGKPKEDTNFWYNDLYKDDPSEWGMAVAVGHLKFQAKWNLVDTEILLQLGGDNYDIMHRLQYRSTLPEHIDLMKKAEEKAKKGIW